ncbi:MAG: hypothetical protein ACO3A2_08130 [Bdellovibrionia bacterium]
MTASSSALSQAWFWTHTLLSLSLIQQHGESLITFPPHGKQWLWPWEILKSEFEFLPKFVQKILNLTLCDDHFRHTLQIAWVLSWVSLMNPHPLIFGSLLGLQILVLLRWRGTYNGGSDFMTLVVLSSVGLGSLDSGLEWLTLSRGLQGSFQKLALGVIAIQACSSYWISGLAKVRRKNWRTGVALRGFLKHSLYEMPAFFSPPPKGDERGSFFLSPKVTFLLSLGVLLLELGFPLVLISPQFLWPALVLGGVFHLGNALFLGLNRFILPWCATYPALIYFSSKL